MDRFIASDTVPIDRADRAPLTGVPGLATYGDPNVGQAPTEFPPYAFNMVVEELRNTVLASGIVPAGDDWTQLSQAIPLIIRGRAARRPLVILNVGAGNYVVPAGVYWLWVRGCAGGGGGASAGTDSTSGNGGGGGAGGYFEGWLAVVPGQVIPYVVGGGGAAGGLPNLVAGTGGGTVFGTFGGATGGLGGYGPNVPGDGKTAGGPGGLAAGPGIFCINGQSGSDGGLLSGASPAHGGSNLLGFGGRASSVSGVSGGDPGTGYGAGGGSGYANQGTGSGGRPGAILIEEYTQ